MKVFTDRSRIEAYQRCHRLRFLEYHEQGMGIRSARKPLPLAVGGSVHAGLAVLLRRGQEFLSLGIFKKNIQSIEAEAVEAALEDFAQLQAQLDVGEEANEMARVLEETTDPELRAKAEAMLEKGRSEFDQYLYDEQRALVEAMVRAYARRRLWSLLEQYEVLEVEREGSWLLSSWLSQERARQLDIVASASDLDPDHELYFMSRPDALLLERGSNQLYILSFKTAAKWDRRKAEDAKRDMQGLSEGVEVEKRLAEWWTAIQKTTSVLGHDSPNTPSTYQMNGGEVIGPAMFNYLVHLPAPPRIMGIRYEYLLKGDRWIDKDLTARLGVEVRSQRSPLVRGYMAPGMVAGDEQWNVAWDYVKETGEASKLYYKNWKSSPVFEHMAVKQWIDWLDASVMASGEEGREMGFASKAQTTGYLTEHPLDALFIPPIIVYRNDDELRDWIEQVEAQEARVAQNVANVRDCQDEGMKRHLLNTYFPMSRRACEYPTTCAMVKICFGGEDIRRDPLGSGLYVIREPHHPQEVAK